MVAEKEKTDKRLELISKISELADEMTLEYLEELKQRIDDTDTAPKERLKAFAEMDKNQNWGGLKKVLTPEGHWLWFCDVHAKEYAK